MARTPVYFLAHGGPTLMEMNDHSAYKKLVEIGKEITQLRPKAVIVFSAHWQAGPSHVEVNAVEKPEMLYDFYGFPPHFYQAEFAHKGSPQLASRIISMLGEAGIKSRPAARGMDHGAFVPFMVCFDEKTNPLKVPVVQVSLYDNEDANLHQALGRALSPLRDEGVVIVGSGMVVHNLRDFRRTMGQPGAMPYAATFDSAVREAVEQPVASREKAMAALLERKDARAANPTFEHLLPIHIAAGAANNDTGRQLFTLPEGSLSWAMYKFGEVGTAA